MFSLCLSVWVLPGFLPDAPVCCSAVHYTQHPLTSLSSKLCPEACKLEKTLCKEFCSVLQLLQHRRPKQLFVVASNLVLPFEIARENLWFLFFYIYLLNVLPTSNRCSLTGPLLTPPVTCLFNCGAPVTTFRLTSH